MTTEKTKMQPEIIDPDPSDSLPKADSNGRRLKNYLARPEVVTVGLIILAFIAGTMMSPFFLDAAFLFNYTSLYIEVGIMAIAMTFIIISGNIDLSVASILALVAAIVGVLYFDMDLPMVLTILIALVMGALLGAFNGFMIVRTKLPALAVTLATLALYRGIAQVLLGDDSRPRLAWSRDIIFPTWFTGINRIYIPGTSIPLPLVIFIVLAIILGIVLHRTTFGRWVYATGTNEIATRYSGIRTDRLKVLLFSLSGFMAAIAGLIMVSRLSTARYDHARGWELDVITAVVLGGTSIFGGRGTMFGTVAAYLLLIILRTGMGVANVKAESQLAVIGSLLIIAILVSNLTGRLRK
jgi:rhamnose transport system permease protein